MARLTNKAMNKTETTPNTKKNGPGRTSDGRFDSSECRFTSRKERNKNTRTYVRPTNPADEVKIEYPAYTGRAGGYIEYSMSTAMAQAYLDARDGNDKKMDVQKYLCKVVNDEFGLLGYCVRVILT